MRKYLFIALIIGAIGVFTTALLYEFGLLQQASAKLSTYYANAGLIPHGTEPGRVVQYTALILLAFATAWVVVDIPKVLHKSIVVIGAMLLVMAMSVCLVIFGVFFEPFSSLTAILTASVLGIMFSFTEQGSRKRLLHTYLGDRVSESSFKELMNGGHPLFLDGHNLDITVLTVRLLNHSHLRREMSAAKIIEITNLFLRNSGEFLASKDAYLDESRPDCVRVYFGILSPGADHPQAACEAALELRQRLDNLNQQLETRYFQSLDYGIAICTEAMTLGIYQSENATRLSALGDVAEYTRRLAGANANYGSKILLNAATYALVRDDYAVRPMELMYHAATEVMSEAYELFDRKKGLCPEDEQALEDFWQGVIYYREGRAEEALQIFSKLKAFRPNDAPLQFFIGRAQARLVNETEGKPEGDAFLRHGHARILQAL